MVPGIKRLTLSSFRNLISDKEQTDPTQIAAVVDYIRKQVMIMDEGDSEQLLRKGQIKMYPLALSTQCI